MKRIGNIIIWLIVGLLSFSAQAELTSIQSSSARKANYYEVQLQQNEQRREALERHNAYSQKFAQTLKSKYVLDFYGLNSSDRNLNLQTLADELLNLFPGRKKKEKLPAELEKRLAEDVAVLNEQIQKNNNLVQNNQAAASNYIVDLRKKNGQHAFLDEVKLTSVNETLQKINESIKGADTAAKKPAFYVLLNMYYPEGNIAKMNDVDREKYLSQYTEELYKRSLLSSNGILLNVESLLRIDGVEVKEFRTNGKAVMGAAKILVRYQPFIALGRNLKETSFDTLIKTNITTLYHEFGVQGTPTQNNKVHRGDVLDQYVAEIKKAIEGTDADFFANETDARYFTELKLEPTDKAQLIAILNKANATPTKTDNLKDYAGVEAYLKRLFGDYYSKLNDKIPAGTNLKVVTTSDKNTSEGKNAIQLVKEETKQEQTLVLGMHFMLPESETGNVKIRWTALYGSMFDQYVQEELDNIWKDIRLLEGSDLLQDSEKRLFKTFIDVLGSIEIFVGNIRVPESWWKNDKWYGLDPYLAGVINGILDNITGIILFLELGTKATVYINHVVFQAALYAYELSKNEEKRNQILAKLKYIDENWFPILRKSAIDFVIFFSGIDFSNTQFKEFEGFFSKIDPVVQKDLLSKIQQAATLKDLALGVLPFAVQFSMDVSELQGIVIKSIASAAWDKIKVALSDYREVQYLEGYVSVQILSFFVGVGEVVTALRTAKVMSTTMKIVDDLASGVKGLNKSGKIDDVIRSIEDMIKTLDKKVDEDGLTKLKEKLDDRIKFGGLARFKKIRGYLGDSRVKAYLNNDELNKFEKLLRTANEDVLIKIENFDSIDDFTEIARGYSDNPIAFENAIKDITSFADETRGWLQFWKLTPKIRESLVIIRSLEGKLTFPVGNATEIQLASIHAFTVNGDFLNVPMRYNPAWFGEYNSKAMKHIKTGLDELRKVSGRKYTGVVYSGKTYSLKDFNSTFVNGIGNDVPLQGFLSASKDQSVAEGFIGLTKKWAENGDKVAVIRRIASKEGVYIDDISDWGKNLGPARHSDMDRALQIQEEVLMNQGYFKQTSNPIPVMENGVHKVVDGIPYYYVDFEELLRPIN